MIYWRWMALKVFINSKSGRLAQKIFISPSIYLPNTDRKQLHREATEMLAHQHGIAEVTLQIEDDAEMNCQPSHQHDHHTTEHDSQHHHSHQH